MDTKKHILVVDDSPNDRARLVHIFSSVYETSEASCGEMALAMMKAAPDTFDVLLLALHMAGMNGFDVLDAMRNDTRLAAISVIAVSSADNILDETRALKHGACGFISKPCPTALVLLRVRNVISLRENNSRQVRLEMLRRHAEMQMRLNALLEGLPGGVAIRELRDRVHTVYFNEALPRLFGYPRDEFVAKFDDDTLIFPQDLPKVRNSRSSLRGTPLTFEYRAVRKNGSICWLRVTASRLGDHEGAVACHCIYLDITGEKEKEEASKRAEDALRRREQFDPVTGLPNKDTFHLSVKQLLERFPEKRFVLAVWNIKKFHQCNRQYGRMLGNSILKELARVLLEETKNSVIEGVAGCLEADRFAFCLPLEDFSPENLLERVSASMRRLRPGIPLSFDFGLYPITDPGLPVFQMCDMANLARRSIGHTFTSSWGWYDESLRRQLDVEQEIQAEMENALFERQVTIHLQPVYSFSSGTAVCAEVLARWMHPRKGMISPGTFIPLFEKNGFITRFDVYIWEEACRYLRKRLDEGKPAIPLSVNASRASLLRPGLCRDLLSLLERYGIAPSLLRIEVTESDYSDNPQGLLDAVTHLKRKGVSVLMDDFGSGYSSLTTLKDLPVDFLKLDMHFLRGFEKGGRVGTVLTAVLRMASWLHLPVIAEGVKTDDQMSFLRSIGCDLIQGYSYAHPMPCDVFETFLFDAPQPRISAPHMSQHTKQLAKQLSQKDIDFLLGGPPLLARLFSSINSAFCICEKISDRLEILRANQRYFEILGYDPSSFLNDSADVWKHLHKDDKAVAISACEKAMGTGQTASARLRRFRHDGRLVYIDVMFGYIGSSFGKQFFSCAFYDITELASREQFQSPLPAAPASGAAPETGSGHAPLHTTRQLEKLVAAIPAGIVSYTLEDDLIPRYMSPRAMAIIGYSPEDVSAAILSRKTSLFGHDFSSHKPRLLALRPGDPPVSITLHLTRKDGSRIWLHLLATVTDEEHHRVCYCVFSDITAEKAFKSKQAEQEHIFKILLDGSNTLIFDYDLNTQSMNFSLVEQDSRRVTHSINNYLKKLPQNSSVHPDFRKKLAELLQNGTAQTSEALGQLDLIGTGYRWYRMFFKGLTDENGAVCKIVGRADDVDAEIRHSIGLKERAEADALTDLYNRATTEELVEVALAECKTGTYTAMLEFDIDNFKTVNDIYRHPAGDAMLRHIGTAAKSCCRKTDIAGRLGGDEFCILLRNIPSLKIASSKARELLKKVHEATNTLPGGDEVTISVGVALAKPGDTFSALFSRADKALYRAKHAGKNCVRGNRDGLPSQAETDS